MKPKYKRVYAIILILSLLCSLSGCLGTQNTNVIPEEIRCYQEYLQGQRYGMPLKEDELEQWQKYWDYDLTRVFDENESIEHSYLDLNEDGVYELLLRFGGILRIACYRDNEVVCVPNPFYSGATGEYITADHDIIMIDTSHEARNDYHVYRLNGDNELELVVFFTKTTYGGEYKYSKGTVDYEYSDLEELSEDEYQELHNQYASNLIDIKWNLLEHLPDEKAFENDAAIIEANRGIGNKS